MRSLLKHPAEWRTLAFMAIFVACSRTLWRCDTALAAAGPAGWLLLLLLWFTLCFFSAIAAVITHNALHVPAFNYAAPQLALQCLLTVAYGQPVSVYLPVHNRSHHRHTGTRADLMRPQKMPHRWNALNLFTAHLYSPGTGAGVRVRSSAFHNNSASVVQDQAITAASAAAEVGNPPVDASGTCCSCCI